MLNFVHNVLFKNCWKLLKTKYGLWGFIIWHLFGSMLKFLDKKDHGLCKRKFHDDESFSIISLLRKKLQEHSRSLQKESTSVTSSTNSATDPLLLSFVYNPSQTHEPKADSSAEPSSSKMLLKDNTLERYELLLLDNGILLIL